jgi:FdhE protein
LNSRLHEADRRWEERIERAQALQSEESVYVDGLRLYATTLKFQRDVARTSNSTFDPARPLRRQIDIAIACSRMPGILDIALRHGPEKLRVRAKALHDEGEAMWQTLFKAALDPNETHFGIDDYFVRACLQPIAENFQSQSTADQNFNQSKCPACEGLPQLAVLRPEGEGASRFLLCSFCLREWLFRRIVCPFCGEESKEKLPRYSAEQFQYVHVQGCDTCKHYLKAVDMSIDGRAVPLVDEVGTAVLDVWANEHGYAKIYPNLIGF